MDPLAIPYSKGALRVLGSGELCDGDDAKTTREELNSTTSVATAYSCVTEKKKKKRGTVSQSQMRVLSGLLWVETNPWRGLSGDDED